MSPVLLDTGPVVALLDASDSHHKFVLEAFAGLDERRTLITSGAIVTEILFHLQSIDGGCEQALGFLEDASVRVEEVFLFPQLRECIDLMTKYGDTPMDFADATLVHLASQFETLDVLTLDERGFRTYRVHRNRRFRLMLQDR